MLPFEAESHRIVEGAIRSDDAMDLLVTAPALGLADALKKVETDALKERLVRAQDLRSVYNERLDAESFQTCSTGSRASSAGRTPRSAPARRSSDLREWARDRDRLPGDPALPRGRPRGRAPGGADARRRSSTSPSSRATT